MVWKEGKNKKEKDELLLLIRLCFNILYITVSSSILFCILSSTVDCIPLPCSDIIVILIGPFIGLPCSDTYSVRIRYDADVPYKFQIPAMYYTYRNADVPYELQIPIVQEF